MWLGNVDRNMAVKTKNTGKTVYLTLYISQLRKSSWQPSCIIISDRWENRKQVYHDRRTSFYVWYIIGMDCFKREPWSLVWMHALTFQFYWSHFRSFTISPHLAGTEQNLLLAKKIQTQWKKFGLDSANLVHYDVLLSYPNETNANYVSIVDGHGTEVMWNSWELSWNPWFVLCPWDRISLFRFCWPGICCMSQTVLKSVARCTQPKSLLLSCSFTNWNAESSTNINLLIVWYCSHNSETVMCCTLQCLFVLSTVLIP